MLRVKKPEVWEGQDLSGSFRRAPTLLVPVLFLPVPPPPVSTAEGSWGYECLRRPAQDSVTQQRAAQRWVTHQTFPDTVVFCCSEGTKAISC